MSYNEKRRDLSSGRKIGKYQLEEVIHKGKYRTIFKAYDPFLDRNVAIKVSAFPNQQDEAEDSQQIRTSFFSETRAVGKLQHPNIVSVYDAGVGDHQTYIVMEYIHAKSLEQILQTDERIPLQKAINIVFKCCKALEYAHQNNIVHRDVKPGNILVTDEDDVKLVDFGVAKIANEIDYITTGIFGSPSYMAPEQVEEHEVSPSTDLYSLGAVFYELLTGKKVFEADNIHTLMYKILNEHADSLASNEVEHASTLQPILDKALVKNSRDRYTSASEFASALRSIDLMIRHEKEKIVDKENFEQAGALKFFENFSNEQFSEFNELATWISVEKKDAINAENEADYCFYIVVNGEAAILKSGQAIKILREGDCFGEQGYLTQNFPTLRFIANTDMLLMKVNTTNMDRMSVALQAQFYKAVSHSIIKHFSEQKISADKAA